MALDLTGNALAALLSAAGFGVPPLPPDPSAAQIAAYNQAVAAQAEVYGIILTYIATNAVINTVDTVPATGIDDSGGHACTGTATGAGVGTLS